VIAVKLISLAACSESDVVQVFEDGLAVFLRHVGGRFASRSVTSRAERDYPSDRDFVFLFGKRREFSIHLFGLQFKRWVAGGYSILTPQLETLRRMARVVAYCLPHSCLVASANSLHYFDFVDPASIPVTTTKILSGQNVPCGFCEKESEQVAQRAKLTMLSRAVSALRRPAYPALPIPLQDRLTRQKAAIDNLVNLVKETDRHVRDALEMQLLHCIGERNEAGWGHSLLADTAKILSPLPHCSWGEFLSQVEAGAVTVDAPTGKGTLPGNPEADDPSATSGPPGVGLRIRGKGASAKSWASETTRQHVKKWLEGALSAPAAVVAYDSYSRAMLFLEHLGTGRDRDSEGESNPV